MAATSVVRFVQAFISQKSSEALAIPVGFNENFPDPLPITVELLDCCGRSWTVNMKKRGEEVFLTLGWVNFVRDNNLEDGKFLKFVYDRDRTFYVIIYGHSGCSEYRDFPQVEIDVDDYEIGEEEEEEDEGEEKISN